MKRPRLLFVKHRLPAPIEIGSDAVTFGTIECLRDHWDITVISVDDGTRARHGATALRARGVGVRLVEPERHRVRTLPVVGKLVINGVRILAGVPREYQVTSCTALGDAVDEEARSGDVALAQFEYWTTGRYRNRARCRAALLNHDVWFHTLEQLARYASSAHRRRVWRLEARTTRRYETETQSRFDDRLFLTEEDRTRMASAAGLTDRLSTVPVAFPFPPADRAAGGSSIAPIVVHLGSMDAPFNVDAVSFFTREVWPMVRRAHPSARFVIVGRAPGDHTRRLAGEPGVEVAGFVDDLSHLLESSSVFVVPARIGSGIKVKVAEALAAGLPVVGTPIGLAGYGSSAGLVRAQTAHETAHAILRLLGDDATRRRAGRENLARYRESFWTEGIAPRVLRHYDDLTRASKRG